MDFGGKREKREAIMVVNHTCDAGSKNQSKDPRG